MRTKRITTITSFSTTTEMYDAIRRASHELQINASDLIRQAIEEFLEKHSLNFQIECSGMNKQTKPREVSQHDNVSGA
jgi:hypothetical protein